jgi:glycerol kinase
VSVRTLVLDIGTSSVRASLLHGDGRTERELVRELLPESPADGVVQFDAAQMAATTLMLAREVLDDDVVDGVGITNQRASTIVWDRATGEPVGPGLGWQDLRTLGECFAAREHHLRLAPNQTATKAQWLLDQADPGRTRDLVIGTVDTWIVWTLTNGATHVTDTTNAGVTGLANFALDGWSTAVLEALRIPSHALATIVASAGEIGRADALPGAPPIVAILGDQQASLAGQACVEVGQAKITFGTGGMLDQNLGARPHATDRRYPSGSFPIAAWRVDGETTWGLEAVMLAAGTNIQWLRDELGLISSASDSHRVASECASTDGVVYVPALVGLGTPAWDYGARSGFFGVTRGTSRAQVVRAVLEGIAHRGADLVEAAEADSGIAIPALRIDGGMSDNPTFVRALADAAQKPVEIAPVREATTLGAGLVAALAVGEYTSMADLALTWDPRVRIEPGDPPDRDRWRTAVERSRRWIPELSGIDF